MSNVPNASETNVSTEQKIAQAADIYVGYQRGVVTWRNAHSTLRRFGVPTEAINDGLHTRTIHQVPAVIRSYLEV